MSHIQKNIPLKSRTSFNIGGPARYFTEIHTREDITAALAFADENRIPTLLLSGGSNMLVSDDGFDGLVISIENTGIEIASEDDASVELSVAAGERWDDVVAYAVEHNLWGIENMSLIPGKMGAIPVQNVGAYGQEAKQFVVQIEAYDTETKKMTTLDAPSCHFGYRSSIFNTTAINRYLILSVHIRLQKKGQPNSNYPDVQKYFADKEIETPTIQQIREAIIFIRESKLPHPPKLGSAGSFFKNTIINEEQFAVLQNKVKANFDASIYEKLLELKNKFSSDNEIKIPTAFLIDICDLKGTAIGGAAVHTAHALAIINATNTATAEDVLSLMKKIRQTVFEKTGVEIHPEPLLVGFEKEALAKYFELT